jgi:hypothetical protein
MFEYLRGKVPGMIFDKMLLKSEMMVIGNLSQTRLVITSAGTTQKVIKRFLLSKWLPSLTQEERSHWNRRVADDLKDGGGIFGSKIEKEYNWSSGKKQYLKQLLIPQMERYDCSLNDRSK